MTALPMASPALAHYRDSSDERWADSYCRAKFSAGDEYGLRDPGSTAAQLGECIRTTDCALSAGRIYGYADRRYAMALDACAPRMEDPWDERMDLPASANGTRMDLPGKRANMFGIVLLGAALVLIGIWLAVHVRSGSAL